MRSTVWCVVALACDTSADVGAGDDAACPLGPPGPAGPSGEPGEPGSPGEAAYHWVDVDGAIVTDTHELVWIDPATDLVWSIDPETGGYTSGDDGFDHRYYEGTHCTGDTYVVPPAPRVPFRPDGAGYTYKVRQDWDQLVEVCAWSVEWAWLPGVCSSLTSSCLSRSDVVWEAGLIDTYTTAPPPSPWVGPLRREL